MMKEFIRVFKEKAALPLVVYLVVLAWFLSFVSGLMSEVTILILSTVPLLMWHYNFVPNKIDEVRRQNELINMYFP